MTVPDLFFLLQPQTPEGVLDSMLVTAADLGLPVTAWQAGSVARTMLTVFATSLSQFTSAAQVAAAGGFLDYSSGDWLTLEADQVFDVQREEATFATGALRLSNTTASAVVLAPGDVRAYSVQTGATYTSSTGGTLPPQVLGVPGTLDLTVVADVAGSGSSAIPGLVSQLVTPVAGVTCTNLVAYVGTDAELDEPLRQRCRLSMARATPNAVASAFEFFALSALLPSGAPAGCTRVLVAQGDGTNTVYCASSSGPLTGDVIDPATPLGAVDLAINDNCVVTGLAEETLPAVQVLVPVSATVYLRSTSTLTDAEAQGLAGAGLIAFFSQVPIGGYNVPPLGRGIFTNNLETAIEAPLAGQILQVVMSSPVPVAPTMPSIAMSAPQVAVLGPVTISVQRVS